MKGSYLKLCAILLVSISQAQARESEATAIQAEPSQDYCPVYSKEYADRIISSESVEARHCDEDGHFRAAVFEHNRLNKANIDESIDSNLVIFEQAARRAASEGAKIIVFPEDGIFHSYFSALVPALTSIPDPETLESGQNNPCLTPNLFESKILRNLSCIARANKIYVVANFGTKQDCVPDSKVNEYQVCPERGFLALNTDVIIDSDGNYVKRYHKFNTFIEVFDKAPNLEVVYLDTPFGRFGIITCFDILFERPAISLIEGEDVDTILFPTWWYDEIPILTAVQFQDAWSSSTKANLLAANINKLAVGSIGSGIFSGNRSVYTGPSDDKSKLLIATIPKKRGKDIDAESFNSTVITFENNLESTNYTYLSYTLTPNDTIHTLELDGRHHETKFCKGGVCCQIIYQTSADYPNVQDGRVILIIRNGLRLGEFHWYEEVCFVASLKKPFNEQDLKSTQYSDFGLVGFKRLELIGTFSTRQVFPVAGHDSTELVERQNRKFECYETTGKGSNTCKFFYLGPDTKAVYAFGLYGRKYRSDAMPPGY